MLTTSEKIIICLEKYKDLINKGEVWESDNDKKLLQYISEILPIIKQIALKEEKANLNNMTDILKIESKD